MSEPEALALRTRIQQASPETHVDVHWHKPAGTSEAVYTLWLWVNETTKPVVLNSEAEAEQWIARQVASRLRDVTVKGEEYE